jgi:hypothetical protein
MPWSITVIVVMSRRVMGIKNFNSCRWSGGNKTPGVNLVIKCVYRMNSPFSCYFLDLGISLPGLRSRMFYVLRKEIKMFFFLILRGIGDRNRRFKNVISPVHLICLTSSGLKLEVAHSPFASKFQCGPLKISS